METIVEKQDVAVAPIEVISCTVSELFNSHNNAIEDKIRGIITIPEYQRPYLWSGKEVDKLVSDLFEHFSSNISLPKYYLGSIILHRNGDKLNVIDGQQRITTLAIVAHLLKQKSPDIQYYSPVSISNIQKNRRFLDVENYKDKLSKINFDELNITLIVTQSEDDAYTFFETQNTGGVRLTGVDIIKAHHLREVTTKGGQQDYYAQIWECQQNVDTVIEQAIKARRWGYLNWKDVPSDRDIKGTKTSIIEEFSEWTLPSKEKKGFQYVVLSNNYTTSSTQPSYFAIRQPLANGENFIEYLQEFCMLYKRLFLRQDDGEIQDEYYKFNTAIIKVVDGTAFLKEFYEIAVMCYANRFGVSNLLEAAYWIFRYAYSPRVVNQKTVREETIPAFLKGNYLLDIIVYSFTHEELVKKLKSFTYNTNTDNSTGNTVKRRFIDRVCNYFNITNIESRIGEFDSLLVNAINNKLDGKNI
jgi:hypothetical protein